MVYVDLNANRDLAIIPLVFAANSDLGLAASSEYATKFGQPRTVVDRTLPEGFTVVAQLGENQIVRRTEDELTDDTIVWPFPAFHPNWADGFQYGDLVELYPFIAS